MTHTEQKKKRYPYDWRKYRETHPWAKHWYYAKARSIHLGREMTLKVADFKVLWERDKAHLLKRPSIDRLDNDKGYIEGNCRFIERSENCRNANLGRDTSPKQREQARKNLINWHKQQGHVLH